MNYTGGHLHNRCPLPVCGLLLALFAQVALAARHTSITLDEPLHITSGYACLTTGDYRLVEEHPPLLKILQALPLLLAQPRLPDPRTVPGWDEGNLIAVAQHVIVPYRPIEPLVLAARVPTMLIGVLLAAFVYRWAADAFGVNGGLLALVLCAFDPNILAHAGVAATDLGAACALFAATYTFWRWLRDTRGPSWRRSCIGGIVLGLALGVKTTALLLPPIFVALLFLARPARRPLKPYLLQALAGGTIALVVLWALYRFEVGSLPGLPFAIPMPGHLLPLLRLREHMQWGHSAFLMGRNYHYGVWYYFPVAFALKTPPLTLALLVLTPLGLVLRRLPSPGWRQEMALLALPVAYFSVSLFSRLNIGYRHLLPVLPFLFVFTSRITCCTPPIASSTSHIAFHPSRFTHHVSRITFYALLSGYAITTLALFPWHLAYFNLFAGGPDGGYRYLVDSNLDWGQTWKALRQYLDEQGITEFGLSQCTINDPHAYGLDYTPLPPWPDAPAVLPHRFDPPPGVYAISTTTLQGVVVADAEMFDYFRKIEPVARVGHAMFVYRVEAHPEAHWAAQCIVPVAPLPPDILTEGLGRTDLRVAYFDCRQSWLYPPGNGWYILSRDYGPESGFQAWGLAHLQRARLAYEQARPSAVPPFAIYEWFGQDALAGLPTAPVIAAPRDWPPSQAGSEGVSLAAPVTVGRMLAFLGYVAEADRVRAGQAIAIQAYWRTTQTPQQPFSLMAHLLGENGIPIAVGDGLGVPYDQLQPGDVIVQRHVFEIPPGTPPGAYWLQVGAYTLPDVQRLSISQNGTVISDRVLIGQIQVIP